MRKDLALIFLHRRAWLQPDPAALAALRLDVRGGAYRRRPAVGREHNDPTRRRADHRAALRPLRPGLHRLSDRLVALCPETAGARRPGHQLRVHVRRAADRRHPGRRHRATKKFY
jgi:hypothetical protein